MFARAASSWLLGAAAWCCRLVSGLSKPGDAAAALRIVNRSMPCPACTVCQLAGVSGRQRGRAAGAAGGYSGVAGRRAQAAPRSQQASGRPNGEMAGCLQRLRSSRWRLLTARDIMGATMQCTVCWLVATSGLPKPACRPINRRPWLLSVPAGFGRSRGCQPSSTSPATTSCLCCRALTWKVGCLGWLRCNMHHAVPASKPPHAAPGRTCLLLWGLKPHHAHRR